MPGLSGLEFKASERRERLLQIARAHPSVGDAKTLVPRHEPLVPTVIASAADRRARAGRRAPAGTTRMGSLVFWTAQAKLALCTKNIVVEMRDPLPSA